MRIGSLSLDHNNGLVSWSTDFIFIFNCIYFSFLNYIRLYLNSNIFQTCKVKKLDYILRREIHSFLFPSIQVISFRVIMKEILWILNQCNKWNESRWSLIKNGKCIIRQTVQKVEGKFLCTEFYISATRWSEDLSSNTYDSKKFSLLS